MTDKKVYRVLFLCTGNSARSVLAEAILHRVGRGRFKAYSAGSQPMGDVHPLALDLLKEQDDPTDHLRSKSWDEFAGPGAPEIDFIFTVCDNAAGEVCPIWPGHPMTVHWGLPDPAAVHGPDAVKRKAFADTMRELGDRIGSFVNLPIGTLDQHSLRDCLAALGRREQESA